MRRIHAAQRLATKHKIPGIFFLFRVISIYLFFYLFLATWLDLTLGLPPSKVASLPGLQISNGRTLVVSCSLLVATVCYRPVLRKVRITQRLVGFMFVGFFMATFYVFLAEVGKLADILDLSFLLAFAMLIANSYLAFMTLTTLRMKPIESVAWRYLDLILLLIGLLALSGNVLGRLGGNTDVLTAVVLWFGAVGLGVRFGKTTFDIYAEKPAPACNRCGGDPDR